MSKQHQTDPHGTYGLEGALDGVQHRRDVSEFHDHREEDGSNDHLAAIYESQEEQFETIVPFIQQGLEQGERCLYVADDNSREAVLDALREGGIDVGAALDSGALSIHTKADTYLRTGEFEQEAMLDFWRETLAEARDEDEYEGVRAAAEMTWVLDEGTGLDRLTQYEAMLNTIYSGDDYVVLCQYNRKRFPPEVLSDVVRSHPLVVSDGTVCQNFYYHPPDEFFDADHQSLDVDRTVEGLVSRARTQYALEESEERLRSRIHQQEVVAELGQHGLEERDLDSLLAAVTEQVIGTLDADYCTMFELRPEDEELLVRESVGSHADVGSREGTVGDARVDTDRDSQAGYTLRSGGPIVVEDLATESRFDIPDLLVDRDVTSGISVVVGPEDDPWGVLSVHTRDRREFSEHDAAFVQSVANTVASAVERAEQERYLRELYEITSNPDRSFEEKLDALFDLGCEIFDLDTGGMARVDPSTNRFEVETMSEDHEHLVPGAQVALSETYCRQVTDGGETAVGISDPIGDGFEGTKAYETFGVKAYLGTRIELDGDLDRTFFFVSSEPREDPFSEAERTFHHLMGQWIESELEQKRREDHLAALNTLSREVMQAETQREVSETIAEAADATLDLPVTAIALYDRQKGDLQPAAATDAAESLLEATSILDRGDGTGWNAFVQNESRRERDPLDETDASVHPQTDASVRPQTDASVHPQTDASVHPPISEVAVFSLGDHGVLVTGSTVSGGFSSSTYDFVRTVAANTEAALDRAHREQQLHEREATLAEQKETLERLDRVNDVIRSIHQALVQASTREEVAEEVCDRLATADAYRFAWIGTHDAVTDTVTPGAWAGVEDGFLETVTVTVDGGDGSPTDESDGSPTAETVRTREAQTRNNLAAGPPFEPWRRAALDRGYQACIAVPLLYQDTLYGVLTLYAGQSRVFNQMEEAVLAELGETIGYTLNALERKRALVSEQSVELEFALQDGDPPLCRIASELDCEFEFENIVQQGADSSKVFFTIRGAPTEEVLAFGGRSPEIEELTVISEGSDETLFECRLRDAPFLQTLLDRGAVPKTLRTTGEEGTASIRVPQRGDVRGFVELFETRYETAELVGRREVDESITTQQEFEAEFRTTLTDRQEEILKTAYVSGFFDWPREMSAQDIAALLDVSQPTVSRHIRAGERKVFDLMFDDEPAQ